MTDPRRTRRPPCPRLLRRALRGLATSLIAALIIAVTASAQPAHPAPPPPAETAQPAPSPAKITLLRLAGDLDSSRLIRDVDAELAAARDAHADRLILQLDGNRWRADVVWAIGQAIRTCPIPVTVWLTDPKDHRVGTGQAALGLLAASLFIAPGTQIALDPGDDLRDLTPAGTDTERIGRELQGALWVSLKDRHADTRLADALLAPAEPLWAVIDRSAGAWGGATLSISDPGPAAAGAVHAIIQRSVGAAASSVRIDSEVAAALGLVQGPARTIRDLAVADHVKPAPLTTRDLASGLLPALQRLHDDLARIHTALDGVKASLANARALTGPEAAAKRRAAAQAAAPTLDEAIKQLEGVESIVRDYPEILRTTPPDHTAVAPTARVRDTQWRTAFQSRRNRIDSLRSDARRYLER